jgi:hypothetical protein
MECTECKTKTDLCVRMPVIFETDNLICEYENSKGENVCMSCLTLLALDALHNSHEK